MRRLVAEDAPPGRAQLRQSQRVRPGAGAQQEHRRFGGVEDLAHPVLRLRGQRVPAIGGRDAVIGGGQRGHDPGMHARGVVRSEIHDRSSITYWSQSSSVTASSLTVQPRTEAPARWTDSGSPEIRWCQSYSGLPSARSR